MSYGATALKQCENLQGMLDEHFQTCAVSELVEPTPVLEFMLSPMNTEGISQRVAPSGDAKVHNVVLEYYQRINEDNVTEDATVPACDASTKRGSCSEAYTIDTDENVQIEEQIDSKDLQTHCQDDGQYLMGVVRRLMDAVIRKVATKTAEQAAALTGKWDAQVNNIDDASVNAQDQLVLETKKAGTVDPHPWTMEALEAALTVTGFCQPPVIFSDFALWQYFRRVLNGCCADYGVDLGELTSRYGKAVMYDRRIRAAFGANEALVTMPGAMALIQFAANEFWLKDGTRQLIQNGTSFSHQVIYDPRTGLKMDLNVSEQNCGSIDIVLTATTKVVALPSDIFGTGDDKDGVRFVNNILVSNS